MKLRFEIEFDDYADKETLLHHMKGLDYYCAIEEAISQIRSRIKHNDLPDDEENFLCLLRDTLSNI